MHNETNFLYLIGCLLPAQWGKSVSDDFGPVKFDSKTVSFSDNKGTQYKIEITGSDSNCFPAGSQLKQCTGIKSNGKRCKNKTGRPSGLCWRHDI
jgi:hypothetical protein